jgi:hypothetical protein
MESLNNRLERLERANGNNAQAAPRVKFVYDPNYVPEPGEVVFQLRIEKANADLDELEDDGDRQTWNR